MTSLEENKAIVRRFNSEVIQQGNRASFDELIDTAFINQTARPGTPNGPESLWNTFEHILRPAFQDLSVNILYQMAEGDRVTTYKTVSGIFKRPIMGVQPTGHRVTINVMDIVRIQGGKYIEHWGVNDMQAALGA